MKKFNKVNTLKALENKKLKSYAQELFYFNKKIPLFSRAQKEDFCWKMILDCFLAGKILLKDSSHLIIADIGSGAGLPGIVLAIMSPKRKFLLFEPHQKKATFLEYIKWKINLNNVQIKNIPIQKETTLLSCAVSKAFLPLEKRLKLTESHFKKGAFYYHLQSLKWKKKWEKASVEVHKSWEIKKVAEYSYPSFLPRRVLIKTCKK